MTRAKGLTAPIDQPFAWRRILASISPLRPFRAWAALVRRLEAQSDEWNAQGLCGDCGEYPNDGADTLCVGCRGNQRAAP